MPDIEKITQAIAAIDANPEGKELNLTFGSKKVQRGEYLPRAEAQSAPSYSWSGAVAGKTYLALSLDLHAPFPSLPILGPILHGMQTGLTASSGSPQLGTDVSPIVRYVPPGPPPFSGPHRYVFLLYEEPADFDAKKFKPQGEGQEFPRLQRIRFDINGFVKEAGLGDVLAGGWFESN